MAKKRGNRSKKEYDVEKVLNKKGYGKRVRYLIKWKGYSVEESTWEPLKNCKCPALIAKFEATLAKNKAKKGKKGVMTVRKRKSAIGRKPQAKKNKKSSPKKNSASSEESAGEEDNIAQVHTSQTENSVHEEEDVDVPIQDDSTSSPTSNQDEALEYKPTVAFPTLNFVVTEIEGIMGEITTRSQRVLVRTQNGHRSVVELKSVAKQNPQMVLDFLITRARR